MGKKEIIKPTDAELEILDVLWNRGPSTVKQVHEQLPGNPPRAYTTVLKLMQIMAEKGLVKRDKQQKAHVYQASCDRRITQQNLLENLAKKAFSGSAAKLVMQALSSGETSKEELQEIRALIQKMEVEQK